MSFTEAISGRINNSGETTDNKPQTKSQFFLEIWNWNLFALIHRQFELFFFQFKKFYRNSEKMVSLIFRLSTVVQWEYYRAVVQT